MLTCFSTINLYALISSIHVHCCWDRASSSPLTFLHLVDCAATNRRSKHRPLHSGALQSHGKLTVEQRANGGVRLRLRIAAFIPQTALAPLNAFRTVEKKTPR